MLSVHELFGGTGATNRLCSCGGGSGDGDGGGGGDDGGSYSDGGWSDSYNGDGSWAGGGGSSGGGGATSTNTGTNSVDATTADEEGARGSDAAGVDGSSPGADAGSTANDSASENGDDSYGDYSNGGFGHGDADEDNPHWAYYNKSAEPAFGRFLGLNRTQAEIDNDVNITNALNGGVYAPDVVARMNAHSYAAYTAAADKAAGRGGDPNFDAEAYAARTQGSKFNFGKNYRDAYKFATSNAPIGSKVGSTVATVGSTLLGGTPMAALSGFVSAGNQYLGISPGYAASASVGAYKDADTFTYHGNGAWTGKYDDFTTGTVGADFHFVDDTFDPANYQYGGPGTLSYAEANQDNIAGLGGVTGALAGAVLGGSGGGAPGEGFQGGTGGSNSDGDAQNVGGFGNSVVNHYDNSFSGNVPGDESRNGEQEPEAPTTPDQPLPAGVRYLFPIKEREFGTISHDIEGTISDTFRSGRRRGFLAGLY